MKTKVSSRRKWLKSAGLFLASTFGAVAMGRRLAGDTPKPTAKGLRFGMLIDMAKCTGCMACAVACKAENGIPLGEFRTWVSEKEVGHYPNVTRLFLPRLCNQCEDPPCLHVCPTGATTKRLDGIVDIDKDKCIGCRHCMGACPYQSRYFNPARDPQQETLFPAATHGTVDKCDFCRHRLDQGLVPACVNTCPAGARIFGDLNDPDSTIHRRCAEGSPTPLLPEIGTEPRVFYVGADPNVFKLS